MVKVIINPGAFSPCAHCHHPGGNVPGSFPATELFLQNIFVSRNTSVTENRGKCECLVGLLKPQLWRLINCKYIFADAQL